MRKQNSRPQRRQSELFWARVVMRKWLNLTNNNSDYSADTDSNSDSISNSDPEYCQWPGASRFKNDRSDGVRVKDYGNVLCSKFRVLIFGSSLFRSVLVMPL
ncbi:uncharacterized protein LOC111373061 isoform X2 [Olea europaea var. sylvestris]|uniref:uncharacterized protein LOC111373061 isoform X2 n=1 Tax=Olea europaea var. sylvestris TaxID=158386 RepID=UPI000C1D2533|nr:uncharacterized protein LOC111373061 isoform X2 [Olea europaea var. sylvestris]XP_022851303.1 uncharacterized protein LOC111373061 isoform X2 [Olea europaea var. sylvestris]